MDRVAPVAIDEQGPVAGAALLYRRAGELRVGVVVKISFELQAGGVMRVGSPDRVVRHDTPASADPTAPLVLASELVPPLPRAEALLHGFAYAPAGALVTRVAVRFVVARGDKIVDKELFVYGEPGAGGVAERFARIAIAGRGPGMVVDPLDPARAAGFGPLGPASPERGGAVGAALSVARASGAMWLPEGFDPALFQAAPADQRFTAIYGDEVVRVEGMHPKIPRLESTLPGVRAVAHLREPTAISKGERRSLSLRADTLRVDAEALRCFLFWRGSFGVPNENALRALRLEVGMVSGEGPLFAGARELGAQSRKR